MELLLASDLHRDLRAARSIVERSPGADAVVIAGDLAVKRIGLQEVIDVLAEIGQPTVLVCGNGESAGELRTAVAAARGGDGWTEARVLHGDSCEIDGVTFFGLGCAVPITPFGDWSVDLSEDEAAELLGRCPDDAVLVSHSPPYGHADSDSAGNHHGSRSVLEAIERSRPRLVVCGHIHASWGQRSRIGDTPVVNAGPGGVGWTLER